MTAENNEIEIKSNELVNLSVDEILEPAEAVRQSFDEDKLYELANSIRELGVIQPIVVHKVEQGYEIIAGHRRFIASKMAQKQTIPAIISDDSKDIIHAKRLHENLIRDDVNSLDVARYLAKLKTDRLLSNQHLADIFGRSVSWVINHLALLEMDPEIQDAVEAGKISYLSGLEIMKVSSDVRRHVLLDMAKVGDASLRIIKGWVQSALIEEGRRVAVPAIQMGPEGAAAIQQIRMKCAMCREECDSNRMINVVVCPECFTLIMEFFKVWRKEEKNGASVSQGAGPVSEIQPAAG